MDIKYVSQKDNFNLKSFDKSLKTDALNETSYPTKSKKLIKLDDESADVHFSIENLTNMKDFLKKKSKKLMRHFLGVQITQ